MMDLWAARVALVRAVVGRNSDDALAALEEAHAQELARAPVAIGPTLWRMRGRVAELRRAADARSDTRAEP